MASLVHIGVLVFHRMMMVFVSMEMVVVVVALAYNHNQQRGDDTNQR